MTVGTLTLTTKEVYERYMPKALTFEQVAGLALNRLEEILVVDCNISFENAPAIATMSHGYAVARWLEQLEDEAVQREIEIRMDDDDLDWDENYALAYPGALM